MDQNIAKNYIVDVADTDVISEAIQKQKVKFTKKLCETLYDLFLVLLWTYPRHPLIFQKPSFDF